MELHYNLQWLNGFVAMLSNQERDQLSKMEGVVSVFPRKPMHTQKTKSWDFIGLTRYLKRSDFENDIVIGVINTNI